MFYGYLPNHIVLQEVQVSMVASLVQKTIFMVEQGNSNKAMLISVDNTMQYD